MIDTKIQLYGSEFLQTGKDQIVYGANYDVAEFRWATARMILLLVTSGARLGRMAPGYSIR